MSESAILSEEQESKEDCCTRYLQKRCILAGMGFGCFFVLSALRLTISLSIVAMVDWNKVREKQDFNATNESCQFVGEEERPDSENGPFVWQPELQGHILGCYFYGFAATHLLGKRLSEISSAKSILLLGTFLAATCTLLVPAAASDGAYVLILLEIFKGFGLGVILPAFITLMENWISSTERVRFITFAIVGIPFGAFFTVILSGVICKVSYLGWKYVFYIFGSMGAVWCLIGSLLIHDSPHTHPNITRRELHYITYTMPQDVHQMRRPVPVKSILISISVWAYIVLGFASMWCLNVFVTVVPLFMGTILKYNIVINGIMSAIPFLVEAFVLIFTSLISNHLQKKTSTTTSIRKVTISIGLCGYAICMIVVTFFRCNRLLSVFLLVMALGMSGFNFASTAAIPIDMSPRFAGTLSAIMNTIGAASGVIIPVMIGYLTSNRQTMDEWSILFYVSAAICLFAFIVFVLFGSSEIQPWNNPPATSESNDIAQVQNIVNYLVQNKVDEGKSLSNDNSELSSQAPLLAAAAAKEDNNKENQQEEKIMNGPRPWRTPSFPEINFPQEPIVFISSSQVLLTDENEDKNY